MLSIVGRKLTGLSFVVFFSINFAFAQSTAQHAGEFETPLTKYKLLIFSGSDWCLPCIRFNREVLQDSAFKSFVKEHLTIEIADFPQHKKLVKSEVEKNEKLAEKYNPNGYFPHVLLLDHEGRVLEQITTNQVNTKQVIGQIKDYLPRSTVQEFSSSLLLMGSSFHITIVAEEAKGMEYLGKAIEEIQKIEAWLSSWQENSMTTSLNSNAGSRSIPVSEEYFELVKRSLAISELTQGAFDISFSGLSNLYRFDGEEHELPDEAIIIDRLAHVGYEKIVLHKDKSISFTDSLLRIGFGAIGKGYAADQVKNLMMAKGVSGGVINASGDLTTWGSRANGDGWNVGIPDPLNKDEIILWLPLKDMAIATSGDYEKFFYSQGQHYSHIINPKTGLPVVGARSVSIISKSAELSDAMATAVSVLGLEVGMDLINQIDDVECVFIDNNRKLHFSNGLESYAY